MTILFLTSQPAPTFTPFPSEVPGRRYALGPTTAPSPMNTGPSIYEPDFTCDPLPKLTVPFRCTPGSISPSRTSSLEYSADRFTSSKSQGKLISTHCSLSNG